MKLENCIESISEARISKRYEIDRVELCQALDLGGLTPSLALIEQCSQIIETHVMIRPRAGDFEYSKDELKVMKSDIILAAQKGARGVVFGCLNDYKQIDVPANKELIAIAKEAGLQCTFHRAFDFVFDMEEALNVIIDLGFDRLLTSGGQATALNGINQIMKLITQANGRIQIMAGSGVNSENIKYFQAAGVDAVHFSIRKKQNGISSLSMGNQYDVDEEKIRSIVSILS